jgi:hypothetical protein
MADQTKSYLNNLLASATWDFIKTLWGPAVLAAIVAGWQKVKHGSLDWLAIIGMFLVASFLAFLNFRKPKQSREVKPQQWKPAWQKLQWANAERQRLEGQVQRLTKDFAETSGQRDHFQQEYATAANKVSQLANELATRLSVPPSQLQRDAISLSFALLDFLKQVGPPPPPKYTRDELDNMPSTVMRRLIDAQDGDFLEAMAFHHGDDRVFGVTGEGVYNNVATRLTRLLPWYQKVKHQYELEFADKMKRISNRIGAEGITKGELLTDIGWWDSLDGIHSKASVLWNTAYELAERQIK